MNLLLYRQTKQIKLEKILPSNALIQEIVSFHIISNKINAKNFSKILLLLLFYIILSILINNYNECKKKSERKYLMFKSKLNTCDQTRSHIKKEKKK